MSTSTIPITFKVTTMERQQTVIRLSKAELQSGYDRVRAAEDLIEQLPLQHEGASTWLLNYGTGVNAQKLRAQKGIEFVQYTSCAETSQLKQSFEYDAFPYPKSFDDAINDYRSPKGQVSNWNQNELIKYLDMMPTNEFDAFIERYKAISNFYAANIGATVLRVDQTNFVNQIQEIIANNTNISPRKLAKSLRTPLYEYYNEKTSELKSDKTPLVVHFDSISFPVKTAITQQQKDNLKADGWKQTTGEAMWKDSFGKMPTQQQWVDSFTNLSDGQSMFIGNPEQRHHQAKLFVDKLIQEGVNLIDGKYNGHKLSHYDLELINQFLPKQFVNTAHTHSSMFDGANETEKKILEANLPTSTHIVDFSKMFTNCTVNKNVIDDPTSPIQKASLKDSSYFINHIHQILERAGVFPVAVNKQKINVQLQGFYYTILEYARKQVRDNDKHEQQMKDAGSDHEQKFDEEPNQKLKDAALRYAQLKDVGLLRSEVMSEETIQRIFGNVKSQSPLTDKALEHLLASLKPVYPMAELKTTKISHSPEYARVKFYDQGDRSLIGKLTKGTVLPVLQKGSIVIVPKFDGFPKGRAKVHHLEYNPNKHVIKVFVIEK